MLSGVEVHQAKYVGDGKAQQRVQLPWTPHEVDLTYEPSGSESYVRRGRKFQVRPFITQCISHANLLQARALHNPIAPVDSVPAGYVVIDQQPGTELLTNGSFEDGLAGWTKHVGVWTHQPNKGWNGGGCIEASQATSNGTLRARVALAADRTYVFAGRIRTKDATTVASARIQIRNPDGTIVASTPTVAAGKDYTRVSVTFKPQWTGTWYAECDMGLTVVGLVQFDDLSLKMQPVGGDGGGALVGGYGNDVGREYLMTALRYTGLDNPLERMVNRKAIGVLARHLTYVGDGRTVGTPGRLLKLPFAPHEVDIAWGTVAAYRQLHARRYPLMGATEVETAGHPYETTNSYRKDPQGNGFWCHIGRDPNLGYGADDTLELGSQVNQAGVPYHVTLLRYLAFDPPVKRAAAGLNPALVNRVEYTGQGTPDGTLVNFGFQPHTVDVVWEVGGVAQFFQARRMWPMDFTFYASSLAAAPTWSDKEGTPAEPTIEADGLAAHTFLDQAGVKYTATAVRYTSLDTLRAQLGI